MFEYKKKKGARKTKNCSTKKANLSYSMPF